MYNVSSAFHNIATADGLKTRIRMYFIGDDVDCTDDDDVEAYGLLLRTEYEETDSNKRVAESGVKVTEYYAKDQNWEIGVTVSNMFATTLMNHDGELNDFEFGRCKVFLDAWDATNEAWLPCPLGVFLIETPIKRRVQLVSVSGYDQMQLFDRSADNWWNSLDFSSGLTLPNMLTSMAAQVGVTVRPDTLSGMTNRSYSYTKRPFEASDMTYRDILAYIAGASASVARFDRDGFLTLVWFPDQSGTVIDSDTLGSPVMSYDLAEYEVEQIDKLQVSAADGDIGVIVGTGTNAYRIVDNPLLYGDSEADILERATPIYAVLSMLPSFYPINLSVIADWSIEAGDVISFKNKNTYYLIPIYQQELTWRGGFVRANLWSSGDRVRRELSATNRQLLQTKRLMHEFEVSVERLLSRISDLEGNYTSIEQTIDGITQTVANQNVTITDILNPDGEIWTAIKTNASDITDVENQVNADISQRQSYVRVIPQEPAIVFGFADGTVIKLKLSNGAIKFYRGADTETGIANAFMYITPEELFDQRIVAGESVQIGTASATARWMWSVQTDGSLALDVF